MMPAKPTQWDDFLRRKSMVHFSRSSYQHALTKYPEMKEVAQHLEVTAQKVAQKVENSEIHRRVLFDSEMIGVPWCTCI